MAPSWIQGGDDAMRLSAAMEGDSMAIVLALLLAFIGVMVAAIGAMVGLGVAVFFGLPATICVVAGAALAVLGAIVLERHALQPGQPVRGHR